MSMCYLFNDTIDVADNAPYGAICSLPDMTECVTTEELNGSYEITFSYPLNGENVDQIKLGMLLYVPDLSTFFKIYGFTQPIQGVIEYKGIVRQQWYTAKTVLLPIASTSQTLEGALGKIRDKIVEDYTTNGTMWFPFSFKIATTLQSSTETTKRDYSTTVPMKLSDALIGSDESLIHYYGKGEWSYDKPDRIELLKMRGTKWVYPIMMEGENLTSLTQEADMTDWAWGVVPYWKGQTDNKDVVVYADAVGSNLSTITGEWDELITLITGKGVSYEMPLLIPLDCSEKFSSQPTTTQLTNYANKYIQSSKIQNVYSSISADAIQRAANDMGDTTPIPFKIGDTISLRYGTASVVTLRVRKREYDVLNEKVKSVEFGTKKTRLTDLFEKRKQTN